MNTQDKIEEFKILIEDNLEEIEYLQNKIKKLRYNNNRYENYIASLEESLY